MGAYYLASNGLLYRNPLIRGASWFVVFDADDEPELVIAKGTLDEAGARLAAISVLEQSGLSVSLDGPARRMLRPFDEAGDARDAYCFWLTVAEPIPAELLSESVGVSEPPDGEPVESFGQAWGVLI